MRVAWVLAALAALAAHGAEAGSVEARAAGEAARAVSRKIAHSGRTPFAVLDEAASLDRFWSSSSFYFVREGQTRRWAIRRAWGTMTGEGGVAWVDSRTCPALTTVLERMEALSVGRPDAPGLGAENERAMMVDGVNYSFWNRAAFVGGDRGRVALTIEGNLDTPVAEWWGQSTTLLKDCWTAAEPG